MGGLARVHDLTQFNRQLHVVLRNVGGGHGVTCDTLQPRGGSHSIRSAYQHAYCLLWWGWGGTHWPLDQAGTAQTPWGNSTAPLCVDIHKPLLSALWYTRYVGALPGAMPGAFAGKKLHLQKAYWYDIVSPSGLQKSTGFAANVVHFPST